jgi:hypothetical protein
LEAELDHHHTTLRFWTCPSDQAWFVILATFDLLVVPLVELSLYAVAHFSMAQRCKNIQDSLIYALRFLWDRSHPDIVYPTNNSQDVEDAAAFIRFCEYYSNLYDAHVAYGRGIFGIEVDELQRHVRFTPNLTDGFAPEPAGMIEDLSQVAETIAEVCANEMWKKFTAVLDRVPYHSDGGRIVIDSVSLLASAAVRDFATLMTPREGIPLRDDDELGGFTAKEFRAFWLGLLRWSLAALELYFRAWKSGQRQYDCLPTQCVPRREFLGRIVELSLFPISKVEACTDRLTYGMYCPNKPDPYLQPLVCTTTHVMWRPHLVQLSKCERNLLKLTARIPTLKAIADDIIGGREHHLLNEFN